LTAKITNKTQNIKAKLQKMNQLSLAIEKIKKLLYLSRTENSGEVKEIEGK
jgi:hypothetical protein